MGGVSYSERTPMTKVTSRYALRSSGSAGEGKKPWDSWRCRREWRIEYKGLVRYNTGDDEK